MERYVYIWEFEVPQRTQAEFLRHYGPEGTWASLFRRGAGYCETILLHDQAKPTRFVTIDRWLSREHHNAFLREYRSEYDRVDRDCQALTQREQSLGSYWEVGPAEGAA